MKKISIELGEFLELRRDNNDYVAVFKNGEIEIPRELIKYASYQYAIPFRHGIFLNGEPNDQKLMLVEKDKECYLLIQYHENEKLDIKVGTYNSEFVRNFNKSYKTVFIREDPDMNSWIAFLSYGDTEEDADNELQELIINDMITWINDKKQIGFILEMADADPYEAQRIAEKYRIKEKGV
jgi:hypothetical protein